ncbi:MAG: TIM-barrel domain-containing protein, partial [Ginsengibacter sp.]
FDNPSRGYLDIGKAHPDVLEYGASSGELTFYLIPGKNVETVLRNFQSLVGTQPVPARWVFGNLMSRFGYRSQEQLTGIAEKMRADTIPFDAVIIDLFWFGDSIQRTMGNLSWDKKSWPAPEKMISNFKKENIKTILITEPYLVQKTKYFEESKSYQAVDSSGKPYLVKDFYFGPAGLLDLYRNDAQDWFWKKYVTQIKKGLAGWWGDLGEPERHPSNMYHNLKDFGYKRLFSADEVHNIYGHYWDKMLFDKYAKFYPNVRLFNLNRSGYAGSGRYGVFPWSGDVGRSWSGLEAQLPVMIGMSMSGVPYIHADAGGFAGGENDQELYTRWLQFAAFTPVFRPHGTAVADLDSNQLNIPSEAALHPEPYRGIVKSFIDLRYSMLPYNYTLGYEQAKYGEPLVRPLFYSSSSDSNLLKASDEFMWGENILVAPVIEKGAAARKLYLPTGKWVEIFTTKKFEGNQWLNENVSLETIPVFVKEGSFVPFADFSKVAKLATTADYDDSKLIVQYYPSGSQSAYTLFLDDGASKNTLEKKQFALINFKGITHGKDVFITIVSSGNEIIKNKKRVIKLLLPGSFITHAIVNQKKVVIEKDLLIKGLQQKNDSYINVSFSGKPMIIKLKIE